MSTYMQPFTQDEIQDGTRILVQQIDIGGPALSVSYVNSTAYWFQVKSKSGEILSFIAPNSKGTDNFTLEASDRLTVLRDLTLKPVTSPVSTNLFYIRFNNKDASSGLSDFNASTALGSDAAQDVVLKNSLPAGNNTIGSVGLTSGSAHIGSVDIDDLPAVDIASVPDVGIKPGQSVNIGSMPDVGIKPGQTFDIGLMPDVGIKVGQTINVGNFPDIQKVQVDNFPAPAPVSVSFPYEQAMTTSSPLDYGEGTPPTVEVPNAIGYLVQAFAGNTGYSYIYNEVGIMCVLLPGQTFYIPVPKFKAQSEVGHGNQILYYTPYERVYI